MKQNPLAESIKMLSASPMSDSEALEAAGNLLGFMELLIEIDREHGITSSKSEAQP